MEYIATPVNICIDIILDDGHELCENNIIEEVMLHERIKTLLHLMKDTLVAPRPVVLKRRRSDNRLIVIGGWHIFQIAKHLKWTHLPAIVIQ